VIFNLVNTQTQELVPAVWKGYWNASPPKVQLSAFLTKRKRAATMVE